jgi:hypothetical protein
MKINGNQLRKIILQEMRHMNAKGHGHKMDHGHSKMMDALMHSAQGCPLKARGILHKMLSRIEPMAHEREMELQRYNPRSNPDNIPQGSEVLSDDHMEETKETKVTAVDGPGHSKGILGPGFR